MAYAFDVVIVGAGVVGLACARQFAINGYSTVLVEAKSSFGTGISSRNSEVIHAGIYYRENSDKSRLCVRGRHLLYDYCKTRGVPHKKIGKWIVAPTKEQSEKLHQLKSAAIANGCDDLFFVASKEVGINEPELQAVEILCSPSTGIVDSHSLMQSFEAELLNAGGIAVYKSPCLGVSRAGNGFKVLLGDCDQRVIQTRWLVNSCGLDAVTLCERIEGLEKNDIPVACFAKGNYFSYGGRAPFRRLIYPVPEIGGLGIHLTLDLNGNMRFGPNVEWIDHIDYKVNEGLRDEFATAIRHYWPNCDASKLQPDYAGVRPKIGTRKEFLDDFCIQTFRNHGVNGLVNLLGIESPGLTASLAIAEYVYSTLKEENS